MTVRPMMIDEIGRSIAAFAAADEAGTSIEYGLIIALVFLAILGAVGEFSDATSEMFSTISSAVE